MYCLFGVNESRLEAGISQTLSLASYLHLQVMIFFIQSSLILHHLIWFWTEPKCEHAAPAGFWARLNKGQLYTHRIQKMWVCCRALTSKDEIKHGDGRKFRFITQSLRIFLIFLISFVDKFAARLVFPCSPFNFVLRHTAGQGGSGAEYFADDQFIHFEYQWSSWSLRYESMSASLFFYIYPILVPVMSESSWALTLFYVPVVQENALRPSYKWDMATLRKRGAQSPLS